VSVGGAGEEANGFSGYSRVAISADGRYVAFTSDAYASNLVPGDTNDSCDVFLRDRLAGTTERVSVSSSGEQGDCGSGESGLAISADGRYVAFQSYANNLVPEDGYAGGDVFVHDRETGTTDLVSISTSGEQANAESGNEGVAISSDGRCVAFPSFASNLVYGDTNGWMDVFVRDRAAMPPEPVLNTSKSPGHQSAAPGSEVAFTLDYRNVGTGVAHAAYLGDALEPGFLYVKSMPAGVYDPDYRSVTWSLGDLAPAAQGTVGLTVRVNDTVAPGTVIANQATLSATDADAASSGVVDVSIISGTKPLSPDAYWDLSVTESGGVSAGLEAKVAGVGITAAKLGLTGSKKVGAEYLLRHFYSGDDPEHPLEHDGLFLTRRRGFEAEVAGDFLSADLGIIGGEAAAVKAGIGILQGRRYLFPDPFGSGDDALYQDKVITLLALADLIELAAAFDPLSSPIVQWMTDKFVDAEPYRDLIRSEFVGHASVELGELELGFDAPEGGGRFLVKGAANNDALGAAGMDLSFYQEQKPESLASEIGATVAISKSAGVPLVQQTSDVGSLTYGVLSDGTCQPTSYFIGATAETAVGDGLFYEDQLLDSLRFDIPPETVSANDSALAETKAAGLFDDPPTLLGYGAPDLAGGVNEVRDVLLEYSGDHPGVPVASYQTTRVTARASEIDLGIEITAGIGGELGFGFGSIVGAETVLSEGVVQDGELRPTIVYTDPARPPTYQGDEGLSDMMGFIIGRGVNSIWGDFTDWIPTVWQEIEEGLSAIVLVGSPGAGEVPEGDTAITVDAGPFGQWIIVAVSSVATEVGKAIFPAPAVSGVPLAVPYRCSRVAPSRERGAADQAAQLTLVGRTHLIRVEDHTGNQVTAYPPGSVDFQSTATAEQLQGYGFQSSDLPSVRLYHWLPAQVTWLETPSVQETGPDSITLTAGLAEAGQYALGIVCTPTGPVGTELMNMAPAWGQLCPAADVRLEAIFRSDAGMDPGTGAMSVDHRSVSGVTATTSVGGAFLDVAANITLGPGPHRLAVWAQDLGGCPGTGSTLFYVQRDNTFPDVPVGFWCWRQVESTKIAGIVGGYTDGLYHPELSVTRDQMAVYIARAIAGGDAMVPDTGCDTPPFNDVPCDQWARKHIQFCVSEGVVQGYEDGTYQPGVTVTRDQMAVYVARSLVAPTGEAALADYIPADPRNFLDVPASFWAWKHVEYCVENGVVNGYEDGLYHPEIVVTRDQMAVYVARAFDLIP